MDDLMLPDLNGRKPSFRKRNDLINVSDHGEKLTSSLKPQASSLFYTTSSPTCVSLIIGSGSTVVGTTRL